MIIDQLKEDMKAAMRSRDAQKLETIRYLISEIKNAQIDAKQNTLDDEIVIKLLRTELKRRKDAIKQFEAANRNDLADQEKPKMAIIESYVPLLMTEDAIVSVVDEVLESSQNQNFGQLMGTVMTKLKGQADGALVAKIIKERLA